jgi:hypothetical protein
VPTASSSRRLACLLVTCLPAVAAAQQQGSIQISTDSQIVAGNAVRQAGQHTIDPDVAFRWTQPGTSFGQFELETHATRRDDKARLGRTSLALRGARTGGITWTFQGGNLYGERDPGDYQFSNLSNPAITFTGGFVAARTRRATLQIGGGRTAALRNIFGTDAETLGQSVGLARFTFAPDARWVINARAGRTRTSNIHEFTRTVDASQQAGGGVRFIPAPWIQFVGDASYVRYRATGAERDTRDYSYIAGTHLLLARGSIELNATRFSPGDMPVINAQLQDRSGVFASADYDLSSRARVFGGWESVATNINPAGTALLRPEATSQRGFGGVRVRVFNRSSVSFRIEDGGRIGRPVRGYPVVNGAFVTESDTGSYSAEWQTSLSRLTAFGRYTKRDNVDVTNGAGTFTQRETAGQLFLNLSRRTQLFGGATISNQALADGGNTYVELSAGGQRQIAERGLWLRLEGTATRNRDLESGYLTPRDSVAVGLNGQLSRYTTIGVNVYVDRAPVGLPTGDSGWMTRSTLRLVRTIPTGEVRLANSTAGASARNSRGTGSIVGSVFADWNGNGTPDAGEDLLAGIPLRLGASSTVTTSHDGQFSFSNVPAGAQQVGLDLNALPVDFDAPAAPDVTVELSRGDTRRVVFGLVPLGAISGRVVEDANKNGKLDPGEPGVDGAVLTIDGGQRSELARKGAFTFDAVRAGDHRLELLKESLPDGSVIVGDPEVAVGITKDRPRSEFVFLVQLEKRPEVRKVFPRKIGANTKPAPGATGVAAPAAARARSGDRRAATAADATARAAAIAAARTSARQPAGAFTVQVAALNDPIQAKALVARLKAGGFAAYLMEPGREDPDGPYRVRVGRFGSRDLAQRTASRLESRLSEKLWVTKAK